MVLVHLVGVNFKPNIARVHPEKAKEMIKQEFGDHFFNKVFERCKELDFTVYSPTTDITIQTMIEMSQCYEVGLYASAAALAGINVEKWCREKGEEIALKGNMNMPQKKRIEQLSEKKLFKNNKSAEILQKMRVYYDTLKHEQFARTSQQSALNMVNNCLRFHLNELPKEVREQWNLTEDQEYTKIRDME